MNVQPERLNTAIHSVQPFLPSYPPHLYIKKIPGKGWGVFSSDFIHCGELIEKCITVIIPIEQREFLDKTILYNYYYLRNNETLAIALGNGSLYNHSYHPNATFQWNTDQTCIEIYAIQDITPDTEITFNYNGNPEDHDPIWFECV